VCVKKSYILSTWCPNVSVEKSYILSTWCPDVSVEKSYILSTWCPGVLTQFEQVQRRTARYVTNCYHNTSSVSYMIGHLNWRSLADGRTDAHLVMLYKITHELVAISKTDILIPLVTSTS
jgi:hypothetical protein